MERRTNSGCIMFHRPSIQYMSKTGRSHTPYALQHDGGSAILTKRRIGLSMGKRVRQSDVFERCAIQFKSPLARCCRPSFKGYGRWTERSEWEIDHRPQNDLQLCLQGIRWVVYLPKNLLRANLVLDSISKLFVHLQ